MKVSTTFNEYNGKSYASSFVCLQTLNGEYFIIAKDCYQSKHNIYNMLLFVAI